ncbi:MAG: hypothetical protein PHX93_02730 [Candidatus Peribacteraceae bacterium]|nr:hypothetical protein [Candidatus Peribacteraceae bacterium]
MQLVRERISTDQCKRQNREFSNPAGALVVASRIAREQGYHNVCCVRYDTAVPYGHFIPWASNPRTGPTKYIGQGEWSNQITVERFEAERAG